MGFMIIKTFGHQSHHHLDTTSLFPPETREPDCEVNGSPVNCGVGLGLEVSCFYHFNGHQNRYKEAA